MPPARNRNAATREVLRLDFLAKISASNRVVLELDEAGQSLQVWPWCVQSTETMNYWLNILWIGQSTIMESVQHHLTLQLIVSPANSWDHVAFACLQTTAFTWKWRWSYVDEGNMLENMWLVA